jgi:anti-sigma B factor antagonist
MLTTEKKDNIDLVTFSVDKINALNTEEIKEQIIKMLESPNSKLLISLSGVEYIDSSGFGCFLSALKVAKNNYGTLKLCCLSPNVRSVFETLQLHTIFEIYPDSESGIRSFRN